MHIGLATRYRSRFLLIWVAVACISLVVAFPRRLVGFARWRWQLSQACSAVFGVNRRTTLGIVVALLATPRIGRRGPALGRSEAQNRPTITIVIIFNRLSVLSSTISVTSSATRRIMISMCLLGINGIFFHKMGILWLRIRIRDLMRGARRIVNVICVRVVGMRHRIVLVSLVLAV